MGAGREDAAGNMEGTEHAAGLGGCSGGEEGGGGGVHGGVLAVVGGGDVEEMARFIGGSIREAACVLCVGPAGKGSEKLRARGWVLWITSLVALDGRSME